jgi:nuclear transport factor 2 (NTF2) superfamily protein
MSTDTKPPVPTFNREFAIQKVRAAENAWNSRNPEAVSMGLHGRFQMAPPQRNISG